MAEEVVLHDGDSDPNVVIPARVRAAAAAADGIHKEIYSPDPQPDPAAADPAAEPTPDPTPEPEPTSQLAQEQEFSAPASAAEIQSDPWAARYNSMRGRFEASQRTIQQMQQQMQQLGDELIRTQSLLQQQVAPARTQGDSNPQPYITPEDEQNYGPELIDLAARAARQAVAPEIDDLRRQNQTLEQRLAQEAHSKVMAALDAQVPNWREIDVSPPFLRWLALRDVYSGLVRKDMLRKAIREADPTRVLSFFKGYLAEAAATGHTIPGAEPEPAPQPQSRQAALPLDTLTAPGRVRPAGGTPPADDNQIFTRAQIAQFYRDVASGKYVGREADRQATERQIFAAQNSGRVR